MNTYGYMPMRNLNPVLLPQPELDAFRDALVALEEEHNILIIGNCEAIRMPEDAYARQEK